jgi:DNA-binding NtrC family response regulator
MDDKIRILVVDDEVNSTKLLCKVLTRNGYDVTEENDSTQAAEQIKENNFDIIISDLQMPELSGIDLLKLKPDNSIFIMITGYGSITSAVDSMKLGAFDYINKPFNLEEFSVKVDKAAERVRLNNQINTLRQQVTDTYSLNNIIGRSKKMQLVFENIKNVAATDINVLIEGQSGTGKELVSRAIHNLSKRNKGPFIAVNCSAIPENLLESELFGHAKGAFTGAYESVKGVFEQANGGTLLLDEIAEMPFNLQSKLLRVIENWEIKPVGSDRIKKIDVRLVCATNQNIKEHIKQKKFREDLYYRIATITISLPPLNDRREDIPLITNHLLRRYSSLYNKQLSITADALDLLMKYDWKGNVRELENVLERAVISSTAEIITKSDFRFLQISESAEEQIMNLENVELKEVEKLYIKKTLEENEWNKLKVAKILGIDRKTLYKKIKEYNLE